MNKLPKLLKVCVRSHLIDEKAHDMKPSKMWLNINLGAPKKGGQFGVSKRVCELSRKRAF